jgi:hypothetical protein
MAIKLKNRDPKSTDFSKNDIVINNKNGTLFFKGNNKLFQLKGDNVADIDLPSTLEPHYIGYNIQAYSASFNYITSSVLDLDASTLRIGGTELTKANLDNLKEGKPIPSDTISLWQTGSTELIEDSISYVRPAVILHPTDNESALIHQTAHRLHFRTAGGDSLEIYTDGGANDYIRLGSTVTDTTEIRLHGTISASINGGLF